MMWGMGDGSSDVTHGQRPAGEQGEGIAGGAAAGAAAGMEGREATDQEMYGHPPSTSAGAGGYPAPGPDGGVGATGEVGDEAIRGRGYNEELGWGQDGWEKEEEVMDDPWQQDQGDDGFFGGGGGGGGGDWGDWS